MSQGACIPLRVHTVVVSVQHSEKISLEDLRADVMTKVIRVVIPEKYLDDKTTFHINPCGLFVVGGPQVSGGFHDHFACAVLCGFCFCVKYVFVYSHLPDFGNVWCGAGIWMYFSAYGVVV